MNEAWADHFNEESRPSSNRIDEAMDKKHDAMLNMAARPQSLQDYLNDQIAFLDADAAELELIRYLISYIDERGYLATPLEDIRQAFGRRDTGRWSSSRKRARPGCKSSIRSASGRAITRNACCCK